MIVFRVIYLLREFHKSNWSYDEQCQSQNENIKLGQREYYINISKSDLVLNLLMK